MRVHVPRPRNCNDPAHTRSLHDLGGETAIADLFFAGISHDFGGKRIAFLVATVRAGLVKGEQQLYPAIILYDIIANN